MYKNHKKDCKFITNTKFLPWVLCCLDAMMKCNRYPNLSTEITVYIRFENHVIVMKSNDHLKTIYRMLYITVYVTTKNN